MTLTSPNDTPTNDAKLGILIELQKRIASVESKIEVANETYEREVALAAQAFKHKILSITWKALADEIRIALTEFRDSEQLLAGEIAHCGYSSSQ